MRTWQRRVLIGVGLAVVVVVAAVWWLFLETHLPSGAFVVDMTEVRRLAGSMAGDKPREVRVERITSFDLPHALGMAGADLEDMDMTVFSYQLVFPDRTAVIDAAMDEHAATKELDARVFDRAAFGRLLAAMEQASFIVVTHEHIDHLGGLATHPKVAQVLHAAKLTTEQLANLDRMKPVAFPPGALTGIAGVEYQRLVAIAPGVVLIKAPGHTPGSQLVYVQRADGAEYLFLGDVAWHRENLDEVKERARLVTLFLEEDRDAVMLQLAALHALRSAEPKLHLVPGHDAKEITDLVHARLLTEGFGQ